MQTDSNWSRLLFIEHHHGDNIRVTGFRWVTKWEWKIRKLPLVLANFVQARTWGDSTVRVELNVLSAQAVVGKRLPAAREGRMAAHQRCVHQVELHERGGTDDHRVHMHMIHTCKECEMVAAKTILLN